MVMFVTEKRYTLATVKEVKRSREKSLENILLVSIRNMGKHWVLMFMSGRNILLFTWCLSLQRVALPYAAVCLIVVHRWYHFIPARKQERSTRFRCERARPPKYVAFKRSAEMRCGKLNYEAHSI